MKGINFATLFQGESYLLIFKGNGSKIERKRYEKNKKTRGNKSKKNGSKTERKRHNTSYSAL